MHWKQDIFPSVNFRYILAILKKTARLTLTVSYIAIYFSEYQETD